MAEYNIQTRYLFSISGFVIFIQAIFSVVIVALLLWDGINVEDKSENYDRYLDNGEHYTLVLCFICIGVNLTFLLVFCLPCKCGDCPTMMIATFVYFISMLAWVAACGVEISTAIKFKDQQTTNVWDDAKLKIPSDHLEELFRRRTAAAVLCFANGLLYIVSLQQSKKVQAVYQEV